MIPELAVSKILFFLKGSSELRLISAHTIDPYIMLGDDRFHRKDLVEITAMVGVVDKEKFSLFVTLPALGNRGVHINDVEAKEVTNFMPEGHGFWKVKPCVEKIYRYVGLKPADQVE